ncbi:MAG TPA: polyprenyl synthetase family protein, partial [Bdellovibrionales bacterium]|nr:polyprenyl synthetase family protein [Bdellovibrionales bacterium]
MLELAQGNGFSRMGQIIEEQLRSGGKRLRARLALAAFKKLAPDRPAAVGWAAACELLHNATLVHDDIQDGDRLRRGHPTAWVLHGTAQAINAGDLMLMLPFSAIDRLEAPPEHKWLISKSLAEAAQQIVRGQSFEADLIETCGEPGGLDNYLACIRGKTAALFRLPVEGAAILAGITESEARRVGGVFEELGVLFQIQDDVLDLYGDKGREMPGQDLREGKVSSLIVEHLKIYPEDRAWLVGLLRTPRERTSQADVEKAIAKFSEGGALERSLARARTIVAEMMSAPELKSNAGLRELATELVASMLKPIENVYSS